MCQSRGAFQDVRLSLFLCDPITIDKEKPKFLNYLVSQCMKTFRQHIKSDGFNLMQRRVTGHLHLLLRSYTDPIN